jgi:hypothetical protein
MTASAPRTAPISRLDNPARTYRSRRFADALTNADAQLTAVVDRYSFNVGLSHPHLYDGLSRRTMAQGLRFRRMLARLAVSASARHVQHAGQSSRAHVWWSLSSIATRELPPIVFPDSSIKPNRRDMAYPWED